MTKTSSKLHAKDGKKTTRIQKDDILTADPVSRAKKKTRAVHKDKIEKHYEELRNNAGEWLEEGKKRFDEAQDTLKEYTGELAKNVQKNPIKSILIAGGIGFILSSLFKK